MSKFISVTAIWAVSIIIGICTLIYGWGLEPKSWWWIIGAGVFGRIITEVLIVITQKKINN